MQIVYAGCVSVVAKASACAVAFATERVYVNDSCHGPGVELESDSALACESVWAVSVNGLFLNAIWSDHVASRKNIWDQLWNGPPNCLPRIPP